MIAIEINRHKFTVDQIYNVDKIALSTVHKPTKVIVLKGKPQIGEIKSEERSLITTGV